jgi:hypothetical protein
MKIIFESYELSAGGKGSPVGLSVSGQKQIDTPSFLRATNAKVYDRGNKLYTLSWEQRREFVATGEAEAFMLLHAANVPDGQGTCTITTEGGATITLTGAVLQIPNATRQTGVSTYHTYQLIASDMAGTVPSSIDHIVIHLGETVTHLGETVTH